MSDNKTDIPSFASQPVSFTPAKPRLPPTPGISSTRSGGGGGNKAAKVAPRQQVFTASEMPLYMQSTALRSGPPGAPLTRTPGNGPGSGVRASDGRMTVQVASGSRQSSQAHQTPGRPGPVKLLRPGGPKTEPRPSGDSTHLKPPVGGRPAPMGSLHTVNLATQFDAAAVSQTTSQSHDVDEPRLATVDELVAAGVPPATLLHPAREPEMQGHSTRQTTARLTEPDAVHAVDDGVGIGRRTSRHAIEIHHPPPTQAPSEDDDEFPPPPDHPPGEIESPVAEIQSAASRRRDRPQPQPSAGPAIPPPATRWRALCEASNTRPYGRALRADLSGPNEPQDPAVLRGLVELLEAAEAAATQPPEGLAPLPADHLDRLYAQYKRATVAQERALNPQRMVRTLRVAIDRRVDVARLRHAITEALLRDIGRHGVVVEAIYWPGFGSSSAAGVELRQRAANSLGALLSQCTIVAAGGAAGDAAVRAGGMARRFTQEITVADVNGVPAVIPYKDHWKGWVSHSFDFLPFALTLGWATLEINRDNALEQDVARGEFRVWANGTIASLGVTLFSYLLPLLFDKVDMPWLDGNDPDYMLGMVQYLNGPRGTAIARYLGHDVLGGVAGIVRPRGNDELMATSSQLYEMAPRTSVWARGVVRFLCAMGLFLGRSHLSKYLYPDPADAWKGQLVADAMLLTWGFWVLLSGYAASKTVGFPGEVEDSKRIAADRKAGIRRLAPPVPAVQVAPALPDPPGPPAQSQTTRSRPTEAVRSRRPSAAQDQPDPSGAVDGRRSTSTTSSSSFTTRTHPAGGTQ